MLAGRTRGRIHSVFATSLNIDVEGFLFHVGPVGSPLSCLGVNVPESALRPFLARAQQGSRVVLHDDTFTLYDAKGHVNLHVGSLAVRSMSVAGPPIGPARLAPLAQALRGMGLAGLIGLEQDERFREAVAALEKRDGASDERLRAAIGFFLGRGPGLTPSGDDVLVGYGIALHLQGAAGRFTEVLGGVLERQTTDVSLAYLRAMMAGQANEGYCELARAAREGRTEQFGRLLANLQDVGSTSGNDGLFGFLLGLPPQEKAVGTERGAR